MQEFNSGEVVIWMERMSQHQKDLRECHPADEDRIRALLAYSASTLHNIIAYRRVIESRNPH